MYFSFGYGLYLVMNGESRHKTESDEHCLRRYFAVVGGLPLGHVSHLEHGLNERDR